jgi:hypothetical protein
MCNTDIVFGVIITVAESALEAIAFSTEAKRVRRDRSTFLLIYLKITGLLSPQAIA